MTDKQW